MGNNSTSPPEVYAAGRRLTEAIKRWGAGVAQLANLIPTERLPGTDLPLGQSTLGALDAWASRVSAPLRELLETAETALAHRRGAEPENLKGLLADLIEKDRVRAMRAYIEKEFAYLQRAFGRRFKGVRTPWAEVLEALDWTCAMRALFAARPMPPAFVSLASRKGEDTPPELDPSPPRWRRPLGISGPWSSGSPRPSRRFGGRGGGIYTLTRWPRA